jgi:hypothetical protein
VYFSDNNEGYTEYPNYIYDGCNDMYDDANMYNTNLTQLYADIKEDNMDYNLNIPYTHTQQYTEDCPYVTPPMNGIIVNGTNYFGAGSQYFSNMYPGMFIIAANGVNVTEFSITGNLGSDGQATDAVYIATAHPGWTAFIKTNDDSAGTSDPSVNHIILVYGNVSGVTQLYDNTGAYDDHCVQGLGPQNTTIITAIVASETFALTEQEALAIANKILDVYNDGTCVTPPAFRLLFNDINNADSLVGDSSSVSDWNSFLDLPALGSPFTSVQVVGNEVKLYGGANIKVKPALMYDEGYQYLVSIVDEIGCITSVGGDAFSYCELLTSVSLPECTIVYGYQDSPQNDYGGFGICQALANINIPKLVTIGSYGMSDNISTSLNFPLLTTVQGNYTFSGCSNITSIYIPSCTALGVNVGDNGVFSGLSGNNITLTVPAALMTCDAGNPDGDIVYLQNNNTVTIVTT